MQDWWLWCCRRCLSYPHPAEDGSGAAKAMELAMEEAGIAPSEVQYINAHGTGTHHNDLFETKAIKEAFGEDAKKLSSIRRNP